VAKKGDGWLWREMGGLGGRWVARLVAHRLATAAVWLRNFESRHLSKIQNGRHKQRSGH
jgi:hypothetical protein